MVLITYQDILARWITGGSILITVARHENVLCDGDNARLKAYQ